MCFVSLWAIQLSCLSHFHPLYFFPHVFYIHILLLDADQ